MSISSMSKLSVTFQFLSLCSHHSVSCHNTCIFIGSKTFIHSENRQEGSVHSVMSNSATPWTAAFQAFLSITNSQSLFKLMSIESMMPSKHRILCFHRLLLPLTFPSTGVFSKESALCIRWPKYCCFSFSISPFIEYLRLISFKIDWFDLLVVQRTLKRYPGNTFSRDILKIATLINQESVSDICTKILLIFKPT